MHMLGPLAHSVSLCGVYEGMYMSAFRIRV